MPKPGDRFEWIDEPDGIWEVKRINAGSMSVAKVTREYHTITATQKKVTKTVMDKRGRKHKVVYHEPLDAPEVREVPNPAKSLVISLNASVRWL